MSEKRKRVPAKQAPADKIDFRVEAPEEDKLDQASAGAEPEFKPGSTDVGKSQPNSVDFPNPSGRILEQPSAWLGPDESQPNSVEFPNPSGQISEQPSVPLSPNKSQPNSVDFPNVGGEFEKETTEPSDPLKNRRPAWRSSMAAFQYVSALKKDEEVRIRDSDRSSGLFLLLSCAITLLAMFIPGLAPGRLPLMVLSDVIVGVMLSIYMINRFGILSTMNKRQALLASQLLIGMAFLGVFIALNIAAIIAMIVMTMNPRAF